MLLFSSSVTSNPLQSHELQHSRLLCLSRSPRICSNSCPLRWWCYLTISSTVFPFSPAFNLSQHQDLFQWVGSSFQVARVLEVQHQYFQWIVRVDFLCDWLIWSPCCPRNSEESSPALQFKSINFSVLSFLYGSTFTSVHDYRKNHRFDYMDHCLQNDVSAF